MYDLGDQKLPKLRVEGPIPFTRSNISHGLRAKFSPAETARVENRCGTCSDAVLAPGG